MTVLNLFEDEPGWTNQQRAEMASLAVFQYSNGGFTPETDRPAGITPDDISYEDILDLMTDLFHLAHLISQDANELLEAALRHYEDEKN